MCVSTDTHVMRILKELLEIGDYYLGLVPKAYNCLWTQIFPPTTFNFHLRLFTFNEKSREFIIIKRKAHVNSGPLRSRY